MKRKEQLCVLVVDHLASSVVSIRVDALVFLCGSNTDIRIRRGEAIIELLRRGRVRIAVEVRLQGMSVRQRFSTE